MRAWVLAAVLACGVGGCGGGQLGTGGGGSGSGGGNEVDHYTWGNVWVHVEPSAAAAAGLTLRVHDHDQLPTPESTVTLEFPPSSRWYSTDGAAVFARHTCSAPSLYAVELYSCPNAGELLAGAAGCLAAHFTRDGVRGDFVRPDGARCDLTAARAAIQVPPPQGTAPVDGGPTPGPTATGTFTLDCIGSDGAHLIINGELALPTMTTVLAC
jgi:hypothetical protein